MKIITSILKALRPPFHAHAETAQSYAGLGSRSSKSLKLCQTAARPPVSSTLELSTSLTGIPPYGISICTRRLSLPCRFSKIMQNGLLAACIARLEQCTASDARHLCAAMCNQTHKCAPSVLRRQRPRPPAPCTPPSVAAAAAWPCPAGECAMNNEQ